MRRSRPRLGREGAGSREGVRTWCGCRGGPAKGWGDTQGRAPVGAQPRGPPPRARGTRRAGVSLRPYNAPRHAPRPLPERERPRSRSAMASSSSIWEGRGLLAPRAPAAGDRRRGAAARRAANGPWAAYEAARVRVLRGLVMAVRSRFGRGDGVRAPSTGDIGSEGLGRHCRRARAKSALGGAGTRRARPICAFRARGGRRSQHNGSIELHPNWSPA
jgi:hypothetical protein